MDSITSMDDRFNNLLDEHSRMKIYNGMRYYKRTRDENNMIRVPITMKEPVDRNILETALHRTLPRFPLICMQVISDNSRYSLQKCCGSPMVYKNDGARHAAGGDQNHGFLTRVGCSGNEITLDFFHGIHDGTGILVFLRALLYHYCNLKYGISPEGIPGLLLADTPADPRELADCMLFVPEEPVQSPHGFQWENAFTLPDAMIDSPSICREYLLQVDANAMHTFLQAHSCSVSAAFSLMINKIIAEKNQIGDLPIVAAMAANARPAYHAEKTLQCCVGTLPVYFDRSMENLSLSEQLSRTGQIIRSQADPACLIAAAQKNRAFNQTLEEKFHTLSEKQNFCSGLARRALSRYTYGISYVGKCDFGGNIDRYVQSIRVQLAANTTPILVEITKYRHLYSVSWMTRLKEDPYVAALQQQLTEWNIPCTCQPQPDFQECIALFAGENLHPFPSQNQSIGISQSKGEKHE